MLIVHIPRVGNAQVFEPRRRAPQRSHSGDAWIVILIGYAALVVFALAIEWAQS